MSFRVRVELSSSSRVVEFESSCRVRVELSSSNRVVEFKLSWSRVVELESSCRVRVVEFELSSSSCRVVELS